MARYFSGDQERAMKQMELDSKVAGEARSNAKTMRDGTETNVALTANRSHELSVGPARDEPALPFDGCTIKTTKPEIDAARQDRRGGPGFVSPTSVSLTPEEIRLLTLPLDPKAQGAVLYAKEVNFQLPILTEPPPQYAELRFAVQPEGVKGKGIDQVKLNSLDKQFTALNAALRTTDHEKIKAAYRELKEGLYALGKKVSLPQEALDFILDEALSNKTVGNQKIQLKAFLENPSQLSGEALTFAGMDATFRIGELKTQLHQNYLLTPLGPVSLPLLAQQVIGPYTDPKIEGSNVCGPEALYYLLASGGALWQCYAGGLGLSQKKAEAIGKILKDKANPGIFGTGPGDLRPAIEAATENKFTLTEHRFDSPQEVISFAVKHVPCLLKFGSGLFSQHYDTILEVRDTPSGKVFMTSSGLAIPEKHLLEMVGQKPYANRVWELAKNNP